MKKFWLENKWGLIFVAPLMISLAIFSIVPFFYGIMLSFTNASSASTYWQLIGFSNYQQIFQDQMFWKSVKTMCILLFPKLLINVFVPFIAAELIFNISNKKAQSIYRILVLLPVVAPGVVGMLIWKNIYAVDGLLNNILSVIDPELGKTDWLNSQDTPWKTLMALILLGFPWIGGTNVLIYLSGLMNISPSVYEAAKIDSCGFARRLFKIDMPLCLGQFRYFLIFGIINGIQDYGIQMALYSAAPDYVYVPGYYLYRKAFTDDQQGYAAAVGVLLFLVIVLLTLVANFITNDKKRRQIKNFFSRKNFKQNALVKGGNR